ncbi:MAG TPA: MFS transporter [Hyphomicrobiaceae bacterium]|nr:MFS transporter [Hyphomicrobiaceae bacterium]
MCLGQVANLVPHVVVPAVMPEHLIPLWRLSGTEAGLMASAYAVGYMLAVPVLATLTDRVDSRLILIWGSLASAAATVAFGLLAGGLGSASIIWGLAGAGFAGAYMPGLKALTDRLDPGDSSRAVTLYTSCFSLGVGLSFLVSQLIAKQYGWRAAFLVTGLLPLLMVLVGLLLEPRPPPRRGGALLDFRPVVRNRPAMGYVLGYGAHCFELYGIRTWIVAFWAFVAARQGGGALLEPITVSVLFTLLAMPSSILGNEAALMFGRHRAITVVMLASATVAILLALSTSLPAAVLLMLVVAYAITVPADSGALTSGMAIAAAPEHRGATMALHSTAGFGLSALGALAFGVALDLGGGPMTERGWTLALLLNAAAVLLGPLALMWSRRVHSAVPSRDDGRA